MFGYIALEKPELKIREYELFRAYYCGVCKSIGKRYGNAKRFMLSYDTTFLALLLSSISNEKHDIKMERCIVHPIHKRNVIRDSDIVDYASDINIMLAYFNLDDNWKDDRSLMSKAAMLAFRTDIDKLKKKYLEKFQVTKLRLGELSELERQRCNSIDMAAEPFAKLMEELFIYEPVCQNGSIKDILKGIGYNVGKWIYILDAFDDLEEDMEKGSYNPLICQYEYNGMDIEDFKDMIKEPVEFTLVYTLSQIAKKFECLPVQKNKGIIENIIYMGMLRKTETILGIGDCAKDEESI